MNLDSADWGKINTCLLRLYRELDAEKHASLILQVLHELVPADSLVINYFKPPSELKALTLPKNFVTQQQVDLVAKYGHQSPYGTYYVATQDASWKMTTDFMPIEDFHKLDLHRQALSPIGANYQIGGILGVVNGVFHIITIHRTHRGFTELERSILNTLHPHLVTSFVNALTVSRANHSVTELKVVMETAPGAYGYFNADTSLAWLQPRAQEWLLEFFAADFKSCSNIPHRLAALVAESQAEGGTPKSFSQSNSAELLAIFLSPSPLGGWILRLERKPKTYRSHFSPLPQLTPRENEVLRWMVEGKRNAEIATILSTSSRTVEKQVQSILAKLEAENRATAILRAMELAARQI